MTIPFSTFRGADKNPVKSKLVWQEIDTLFPFVCDICHRTFEQGGKRWIASSIAFMSHAPRGCECPECHAGIDPFKRPEPKLAERRKTLD